VKADPRIDAYIAKAAPFAEPILTHVRDRVRAVVPDVEETLKWGAPSFVVDGKILLMMAAFKAHAALNFWRGRELRGEQANADAMGQFGKLSSVEDLPPDAEIDALIRQAAELARSVPAPRKPKHAPKPVPKMHPEFAEALTAAPKAKAARDAFPPSAQRDYLEWISDAKQDATRRKRIATAIEWLGEGKRRHWKYENC
jgi:uncharacterized protein YdeI (YjbR/CyaY-like superfamily)